MRSPFYFSGNCTIVEVSVDVSHFDPSGIPFCSIPLFTEPTMVPRYPQPVLPVVVPPPICNCITFNGTGHTGRIRKDLSRPVVYFSINSNEDCCDQQISYDLQIDTPCFPLEVESTARVQFTSIGSPDLRFNVTRVSTGIIIDPGYDGSGTIFDDICLLGVSLDIDIPNFAYSPSCMAFDVTKSQIQTIGSYFLYGVTAIQTRPVASICRISFGFSFMFPTVELPDCMDFRISSNINVYNGDSQAGSFSVKQTRLDITDGYGNIIGRDCVIGFDLNLQIQNNAKGIRGQKGDTGDIGVMEYISLCDCFSVGTWLIKTFYGDYSGCDIQHEDRPPSTWHYWHLNRPRYIQYQDANNWKATDNMLFLIANHYWN